VPKLCFVYCVASVSVYVSFFTLEFMFWYVLWSSLIASRSIAISAVSISLFFYIVLVVVSLTRFMSLLLSFCAVLYFGSIGQGLL